MIEQLIRKKRGDESVNLMNVPTRISGVGVALGLISVLAGAFGTIASDRPQP